MSDAGSTPPASPAPAAPAAPAPQAAPTRPAGRRKTILLLIALAALGFGGWRGLEWWRHGRFMVSTDDAYVKADTAVLSAKISGYVAEVAVVDNERVKAGQVLARIDDGDYRLALRAATDKLATQDAAIARIGAQIEAQSKTIDQARAQQAAAEADKTRADSAFERVKSLSKHDFASQAQYDAGLADKNRALAALDAAKAAVAAAEQGVAVLRAQRVEAERARAELDTARAKADRDLSFAVLTAPNDGVIGAKAVQQGQFVQPGQRLMALVPLDTVYVEANFKETQIARLRPGQKVEIEVDAYDGRTVEGVVASVAPASGAQFSLLPPDNATGNFTKIVQRVPVRIALPEHVAERGALRPGLSVVVNVDTQGVTKAQAGDALTGPIPDKRSWFTSIIGASAQTPPSP
jgi:membrane fusion protein (multidrug efflux system)